MIASLFPTISGPCDTQDFSSFSEVLKDGSAAIYLYDNVYDGVDLTTGAFDKIEQLVEKSLEPLMTCDCVQDTGCFRCIANPRQDEESSKDATSRMLRVLREILLSETPSITERPVDLAGVIAPDVKATCPECSASVAAGDRFCKNCGHELS